MINDNNNHIHIERRTKLLAQNIIDVEKSAIDCAIDVQKIVESHGLLLAKLSTVCEDLVFIEKSYQDILSDNKAV